MDDSFCLLAPLFITIQMLKSPKQIGHVISFLLGEGHLCNGCDVKGELLGKTMTHDGKIVEFDKF